MKDDMPITRRGALQVGATLAAGVAAAGGLSAADAAENLRRFERQAAVDPRDRILLKGGTIISMDAKVGDLVQGDVLIEGKRIAAIAPTLNAGDWAHQWPPDLERLQTKYFSSTDQLVTLRMFSGVNRDNWAMARKLGLRITTEFQGPQAAALLDPLAQDKLVGADNTFNHCGALPEKTWQIFVDTGANINVCPRSDAQYGLGEGLCALQSAWNHGIKPGFSVDNETSYSTDMFMEMRVAFYLQRAVAQNRRFAGDQNPPKPLMVRDMLYCATMGGAHCAGLDDKIGSLAPGKEADLLLIRADDINLYPSNNAVGTVVQAAERSNIDTVIIGSRVRKYRGQVVGP